MKTLRKDYPRVRQYVKNGNTYFQVDLRRKHHVGKSFRNFTDKAEAMRFASELGEKVAKSGLQSIADIQDAQLLKIWGEQVGVYGKTLAEAIEVALEVFAKEQEIKQSPYMAELLTVWLDDKITGLKKLRPKSIKTIRNMANMFKEDFGTARIKEIDQQRVEDYLKSKDVSDQTRENIRNYLGQFFNWTIKKKYHNQNPADEIEIIIDKGTPEFFTVAQCEELLKTASKEEHKALLPYDKEWIYSGTYTIRN